MKKIILLFILVCLGQLLKGQNIVLSGYVVDMEDGTLPVANIILLRTDSTIVSGTTTDERGIFKLSINKGDNFILKIQSIGYENIYRNIDLQGSIDIGKIILKSTSYTLQDVQITGKSSFVRREADRIIFNTKNVAGAVNAFDLLNITPGIIVNGDDVSMFSTQGVKFYINGKEQKISSKEMLQILKSYPAADIDKIELITSPSAKYSADGKAGIINLKLKKKENNFVGGNISYAHTQYKEEGNDLNTTVIYNKGRLSSSVNLGGNWEDSPYVETNTQHFTNITKNTVDNGLIGKKNYFFRGQLDYTLCSQWTLGAYILYNNGKRTLDVDSKYEFDIPEEPSANPTNSVLNRNEKTETKTFNLNAEQKIGKQGKTIWYNFDYYRLNFDDASFSESVTYNSQDNKKIEESYSYNNVIKQTVDNYSGKIDASLPWDKNKFNLGTHLAYTRNQRSLDYKTTLLPDIQYDNFNYNEYVWALYSEYQRKFSKHWSMNAGVRMEYTWTKGKNLTTNDMHNNSYIRLFPSFFLGYNPNKNHSLNFSLINLVTRPNINNVNPNAIQRDRYNVTIGNPDLKPSFFYKGNMGYTYKGFLSFDLFYSYQPNAMSNISSIDENMIRTTRWENCIDTHTFGFNSYLFLSKIKWLNLTIIQGLYHEKTVSSSTYTLPKETNFNYTAVVNAQVFFDSKKRFIGTLSGNFNSAQKTVTSQIDPLYRVDAGLQYSCVGNKLIIGLMCRNLIASKIEGKEYANGVIMNFSNKFQYMMPKLSVTYRWGARLRAKRHNFESEKMKQRVVNDF